MKKLFSLFLCLILLFGLLPLTAPARAAEIVNSGTCGAQGDNLTWTLDSDGLLTISGTGSMYDYDYCKAPWYSFGDTPVKRVVIKRGITSIGRNAFCCCSSLTSISIPDSVASIGNYAFRDCTSLSSITIPGSVTSIADYAFYNCNSLTSITISNSVTSIGSCAFYYCTSLTSISIPDSVISIGDHAFYGCSGLTRISIPDSVTFIGYAAFEYCSSLTSISIPDSMTYISVSAFDGCTGLTSVTIPNSVTSIKDWAFSGCTGLASITIPDSVTSIYEGALYGCTGLTSITIPNSVTSISKCAFYGCTGLTSVTIPNSVTSIGSSAFSGCTSLTNVVLPSGLWGVYENTFQNCSKLKSIVIPERVTSIGGHSFDGCSSLTEAAVLGNVSTIGEYGFLNCSALKSVALPASVSTIETGAFRYCTALTDVYFAGSEEDWNQITIRSYNDPLTSATIHFGVRPIFINSVEPDKNTAETGDTITWTVTASGGIGTLQYYFNVYKDGTKVAAQAYSTENTCSYTPAEPGTYTVRAYAMDANDTKVNKLSTGVTVTGAAAAPAISSVKANKTSAAVGSAITWTAAASGGSGTLQYYFILYKDGAKLKTRSYSTKNTYSYTPTEPGTYRVRVYVKDAADTKVNKLSSGVTVTAAAPLTLSSIKADKTSASAGEKITWTAAASGGSGSLQYYFILYEDGTKLKTRAYSTTQTFSYTPTEAGTYKVRVYVKDANDTKLNKLSTAVTVTPAGPSISSVKAGVTSAYAGEKITWTAAASGGSGTLQYYFNLYKDGVRIKTRAYSTANTFSYTPTESGTYKVRVYVKDAAENKVNKLSAAVTVTLGPPAIISIKAGKTTAAAGEKITWTAAAVGSEQPLQYYFIVYKDGVRVKTRAYSTANTFSYTPTESGTYKVRVYVKDAAETKVNKLSGGVTVTG